MATTKRKRGSCGYCLTTASHRHKDCPGTLPYAAKGKPWTCWCAESGHPDVIPPAPQFEVPEEEEPEENGGPQEAPEAPAPKPAGESKGKTKKEPTARCGHPTKRGPCNRRTGHTAGHDGR